MKEAIINLNDYEQSGSGALGESYISKKDPNILLKLYSRPARDDRSGQIMNDEKNKDG